MVGGMDSMPLNRQSVSKGSRQDTRQDAQSLRLLRLAELCWWVFLAAVCIKAGFFSNKHSTWPVLATGGQHWTEGAHLYDSYPGIDLFRYSPTFAASLAPLARLPLPIGGMLWAGLNFFAFYVAVRVLADHILPVRFDPRSRACYLLLSLFGGHSMIWSLQSNALILACAVFAVWAIIKESWWLAAALLAIPVYLKIWPLVLALLVLAYRPRPLLGRFLIMILLLGLVPFLLWPTGAAGCYQEWFHALGEQRFQRWPGFRDAWTIWEVFQSPVPREAYQALQIGAALLTLLLWLACQRRLRDQRLMLTFLLGIYAGWQLLFGLGSESLTYGVIAPLIAWGGVTAWREQKGRRCMTVACGIFCLYSVGGPEGGLRHWFSGASAGLPVSILMFMVWLVACTFSLSWPLRRMIPACMARS
jgi:glycosyl transferase family 87